MTKAVSLTAYRNMTRLLKEQKKIVSSVRRDGLTKVAADRRLIVREDAIGAYCEARHWLNIYTERLANSHPERTHLTDRQAAAMHKPTEAQRREFTRRFNKLAGF